MFIDDLENEILACLTAVSRDKTFQSCQSNHNLADWIYCYCYRTGARCTKLIEVEISSWFVLLFVQFSVIDQRQVQGWASQSLFNSLNLPVGLLNHSYEMKPVSFIVYITQLTCSCFYEICQHSYKSHKKKRSAVSPIATPLQTSPTHHRLSNAVMVGPNFRMGHRIGRGNFGEVRIGNILVSYCKYCILIMRRSPIII